MKYKKDYITIKRDELVSLVKAELSPGRFNHVLRVEETAINLAKVHGVDTEKVSIAALLHDFAKERSIHYMKDIVTQNNLDLDMLDYGPSICHGPVAAVIAKKQFKVRDKDILNAIFYHTFGRADMSDVEKVVFIADFIEPKRDFKEASKARDKAQKSLDSSLAYIASQTIIKLASEGKVIYPKALETYNGAINQ